MNILKKLTIKNLKLNKKRSVGTIVGIILSVALICAVGGMFTSFQATLLESAINETGYYHLAFDNIDNEIIDKIKLNKDVKEVYQLNNIGFSNFEHEEEKDESPYIQIFSTTKDDATKLMMKIVNGRFPKSDDEIVVSEKVIKKSNYKVGDTIELAIGKRQTKDGYELGLKNPYISDNEELVETNKKSYKIVGVVSKYGWSRYYFGLTTHQKSNNINAYVSFKNPHEYKKSTVEMLGLNSFEEIGTEKIQKKYNVSLNNELLRWEVFDFSESTLSMLYSLACVVIVIIVISSVFCIRNSFAISTLEKMKMYGMLSSIGATKNQIRKSVIYEGIILGLIGIPLGVISGIFADFVLIKIVNYILEGLFSHTDGLVFRISIIPVILSIVLGYLTIYLSSIVSAIKAGRVSPIENLKNTKDIKISSKKLKSPNWIDKVFKTGGSLAYKNLKRSKKKYRTTVISLTVSIMIFISMNAFINETFVESLNYFTDYDYNVGVNNIKNMKDNEFSNIKNLDSIDYMYIVYDTSANLKITDVSKYKTYEDDTDGDSMFYNNIEFVILEDDTYKAYVKKLGILYEEVKDKGILVDDYRYFSQKENAEKRRERYNYKKGDILTGEVTDINDTWSYSIQLGSITKEKPYGYEQTFYDGGYLVINRKYCEKLNIYYDKIFIQSKKSETIVKEINKINNDFKAIDFDEAVKQQKSVLLVISIFLYGFITVITLIGVTNIFNTITSNMDLRSKEFAILKSIGMTKKEFNRMVNLETLFYSSKSLIFGIILGLIGAYFIHKAFAVKSAGVFVIPYLAIFISIIFVFIIVSLIMKFSIRKINKLNTIETIRNENI